MTETTVPHATFRGFLFADLRGYSDFVERQGDHAAVTLLTAYRDLVRSTVARYEGGEIRTEGDSFFVVFGSASRAVSCGMELLSRAAAADPPIRVGVGIHAGEAADTGEGPVGSAVNIAARVCARADAGELLVTDVVRALTRTVVPYRFLPRGTPVLKGITEPVALFRVVEPGSAADMPDRPASVTARPPRARPMVIALGVVGAAVIVVGGAIALRALPSGSGATPSATPSASIAPAATSTAPPTAPAGIAATPSAPPSSPATPAPTSSAVPSPALSAAERDLLSRLAGLTPDERATCRASTPRERASGAVASITCPLGAEADAASVRYDLFDQQAVLLTAFDAYVRTHGDPSADCAKAPLGGGEWSVERVAQGHVLCFADAGSSRIIWTYEGGAGAGIMGSADRPDSDWQRLYTWWQEVHPLIAH